MYNQIFLKMIRCRQTKSAIAYNHENLQKILNKNQDLPQKVAKESSGVAKSLLGELYIDKVYLENLFKDLETHYKKFDKSASQSKYGIQTVQNINLIKIFF